MSDRTDPAWDEYLSAGEDPTGGELEEADEEIISDEVVPGEWQQYARQRKREPQVRNTTTDKSFWTFQNIAGLLALIMMIAGFIVMCS